MRRRMRGVRLESFSMLAVQRRTGTKTTSLCHADGMVGLLINGDEVRRGRLTRRFVVKLERRWRGGARRAYAK